MSVKSFDRGKPVMKYLANLDELAEFTARNEANKPKRFRKFYSEYISGPVFKAMTYGKRANSIKVEVYSDFEQRRRYLLEAYTLLQGVLSGMNMYYTLYHDEGLKKNELNKLADLISDTLALLKGVMNKDKNSAKKLINEKRSEDAYNIIAELVDERLCEHGIIDIKIEKKIRITNN